MIMNNKKFFAEKNLRMAQYNNYYIKTRKLATRYRAL